uniref:Carbonic anhydrase n=1 Tax=Plectus sambesii TaxID=2011161 RepID=A0A914XDQ9_9BILA
MFGSTFLVLWMFVLSIDQTDASTATGFGTEWGYTQKDGPNSKDPNWPELCHSGKHQSPINIDPSSVVKNESFSSLVFTGYNHPGPVTITNNGHSVTATGFDKWGSGSLTPYITGGGLYGKYNLINFHLHWGEDNTLGSEHQLNFVPFPLEAHFVHQRADLNATQSLLVPDGLAVVAVWFILDNRNPAPLKQLDDAYESIDPFNTTVTLNVTLSDMIPANTAAFYRYSGSLTTPGCNEALVWSIMNHTMTVANYQLKQLRQHNTELNHKLKHNYRNLQELNGRVVLRNG